MGNDTDDSYLFGIIKGFCIFVLVAIPIVLTLPFVVHLMIQYFNWVERIFS